MLIIKPLNSVKEFNKRFSSSEVTNLANILITFHARDFVYITPKHGKAYFFSRSSDKYAEGLNIMHIRHNLSTTIQLVRLMTLNS